MVKHARLNIVRLPSFLAVLLFALRAGGAPVIEIEEVLADGKPVAFSREAGVVLPAGRHDLEIRFRTQGETPPAWLVQYQLEGYDPEWRSVDGGMALLLRLFDGAGREVGAQRLPVSGQNLAWPPVQKRSNLNRRIQPLVVAAGAKSLEIAFDSGTWRPELTGEWVIAEVTVNRADQAFGPKESFWPNPAFEPADPHAQDRVPMAWERRGDAAIARLEESPAPPQEPGWLLTLRDFSKTSAGAWVARHPLPADVRPGEVLTVGWWERSRVGDQRSHSAHYEDVPPGRMLFRAVGRGMGAVYQSQEILLPVVIRPHLWARPWFAPVATLAGGSVAGLWIALWLHRRYRQKLARLELAAGIEKDRMRIARDLHDDVGAQLTRLSLMCAGLADGAAPAQVDELAVASRRIAQSMDEIVWAVEPGNDSLDRLGTFLCRFTAEFLEDSGVRARYDVPADLPAAPLSADVRHNLFLAVKEALNNALKHAAAREIRLTITAADQVLKITVADDGAGFDVAGAASAGHGLRNMRARLGEIGGSCRMESAPGGGTRVIFHWPLPAWP